ncbi:MAG: hypothetical protein HYY93_05345 [Planctomycetes bacterium]|nr:hypothetical protein [Planctomycetota bacterium]
MGLRVNTNRSAVTTLRSLNQTDKRQVTTFERLSTGLRINRASDDPSGLVISEILRGQLGSLQQAVENSTNAANLVSTSEAALTEVSSLLVGIRESVIFALNTGSSSPDQIAAEQDSVDQAIAAIKRIADSTKFGTTRLLNGNSELTTTDVDQVGLLRVVPHAVQLDYTSATGNTRFDTGVTRYATQAEHTVIDPLAQTVATGAVGDSFVLTLRRTDTSTGAAVNTDTAVTMTIGATGVFTYREFMDAVNQTSAGSGVFAGPDGRLYSQEVSSGTAGDEAISVLSFTPTVGAPVLLIGQTVLDNAGDAAITQTVAATTRARASLTVMDPMIEASSLTSAAPGAAAFAVFGRQVVTGGDVTIRIRGNLGVEELRLSNGTTYTQFASAVNLLRGNTGVYASNNGKLYSDEFGSDQTVQVQVIEGTGTYSGTGGLTVDSPSPAVSFGTDAKGTVSGAQAFARGNRMNVVSTFFNGEIELNNPGYAARQATPFNQLSQRVITGTTGQSVTFEVTNGAVPPVTTGPLTMTVGTNDTWLDFMNLVNTASLAANLGVIATDDGRLLSTAFGTGARIDVEVTASTGSDLILVDEETNGLQSLAEAATTSLGTPGNRAEMRVLDPEAQIFSFSVVNKSGLLFQFGSEAQPNEQRLIGIPNLTPTFLGAPVITLGDLSQVTRGGGINTLLSGAENDLFNLQIDPANALRIVDAAIEVVTGTRSFLGSFVKDTVEPNVRSVEVAIENLKASESDIRDLDFANEISILSKQQILFQSGISVLAQANSIPQSVLQLLRQ